MMEAASTSERPQSNLLKSITEAAKDAFDPSVDADSRESGLRRYNELIERTQTWLLLHALNTLIKPDILPSWLRTPLMQTLTRLPLRADGVRATLEFVFAVHPSSGDQGAETATQGANGGKGAGITHEAVAVATKLLSTVPAALSPDEWFRGIAGQFFALFDGEAGADVAKTAAQVVGFGILGKRQYGSPGAPGWNTFVQPLLECINPALRNEVIQASGPENEVIELGADKVIVSERDLSVSLQRLELLIISNPSPGLCKRVLKPVLAPLWALASWIDPPQAADRGFCRPARGLIQTYLRLFGNAESITILIRNMLYQGAVNRDEAVWRYQLTANGAIQVIKPRFPRQSPQLELDWGQMEHKSSTLVTFVDAMCPEEEISSVFLGLLRRWIETAGKQSGTAAILLSSEGATCREGDSPDQAVQDLIDVTVLQKLMDKAPGKLVSHFDQLLELVCEVLRADEQSPLGDDVIGIILSLLNLVITSPSFQKSDVNPPELQIVEEALERIGQGYGTDVSATARNLAMLLRFRDDLEEKPDESGLGPSIRQVEDRKTYNLAMSYITGDSENPPPVVSEGLNILTGLIVAESPILDIPAVMVLMSRLLRDNDDFINLRVIKIFTQLANKHPKSTMKELIDNYVDSRESLSTDVRLRFGEAIVQVIERLGATFSGEIAELVGETLLFIAGRRGHRPKTMAKQARGQKLADLKRRKAEAAGAAADGDDGDLDADEEEEEEETAEKQANNAVLASILKGWESKRGSEDIRMRTSALSIFGSAIEIHIVGMGPTLVSAGVDLSLNILAMERGLETGILRRAAILLILSFSKALERARSAGQKLGFGLTDESRQAMQTTLRYIAETDNDGLVQQYAGDVVESLEHWGMRSLLPTQAEMEAGAPGLGSLRVSPGVCLHPGGDRLHGGLPTRDDDQDRPRPKIEEVE